jgi:hypothetical protein
MVGEMYGTREMHTKFLAEKLKGKTLGKIQKCEQGIIIIVDVKGIGCEGMDWINLE